MKYHTIAVLTDDRLYRLTDQKQVQSFELASHPASLSDFCVLANEVDVSHLWIMPGTTIAAAAGQQSMARSVDRSQWDMFVKYSAYVDGTDKKKSEPTEDATILYARVKNTAGQYKRTTWIGIPPYYDAFGEWELQTPFDLLGTVYYIELALDIPLQYGSAHVGDKLVDKLNDGKRREWIANPSFDIRTLPFREATRDLQWKCATLPASENGEQLYMHHFDGNSEYLAAHTRAFMGEGDPVHRTVKQIVDETLPGVYRVSFDIAGSPFDGLQLPPIITTEWIPSDVLAAARQHGYSVDVQECWQWDKKHRTLESWGTTLWREIAAMHDDYGNHEKYPAAVARRNARSTLKNIGWVGVGKFATRKMEHPHFSRPDWWSQTVGATRRKAIYRLDQFREKGHTPVLFFTDGVYFVSPDPDPFTAIPGITERAEKLGGYKHVYSLPVDDEMRARFERLKPASFIEYLHMRLDQIDAEREGAA